MPGEHSRQRGIVVEKRLSGGRRRFALRFWAYGKRRYVSLPDGIARVEAEVELRHVLAALSAGFGARRCQTPRLAFRSPTRAE